MYQCADCGHVGEAAISGRKERRCEACYALLTDAMTVDPPRVEVVPPAVVSEEAPALPAPEVPVEPVKSSKRRKGNEFHG
jgi:hypothetical protein